MAHNAFEAPLVNSNIDAAKCSCFYCDIRNPSEKPEDLPCSYEDCIEPKTCIYYTKRLDGSSEKHSDTWCANMQENRPANPPTIIELISSGLCQLCRIIKPPTTSVTPLQQQESIDGQKRAYLTASEITPSGDYGIMTATREQQESIVVLKKRVYLTASETTPSGIYGTMTATLHQQESIVVLQKRAYLPASENTPLGVYGIITATLQKQESFVGLQKMAYLPSETTRSEVYGIMTATLQQQKSIVGLQKMAYLPKKECVLAKCTCSISDPCRKIRNIVKKESPNICGVYFGSQITELYHMQELLDYLKGGASYVFDVPKICCDNQESSEVPKISCHKQELSEVLKICHKQESLDPKKGAAGYVFDVPKICYDKQESPDLMNGAAGYVFDVPKICYDKQESPGHLNVETGYVFEIPRIYKELSETGQEIGIERQRCKKKKFEKNEKNITNDCNLCNPSETSSSSVTKTAELGSENSSQAFVKDILLVPKSAKSDRMSISCKLKNGSDSQQYKPTKTAEGLFKNILQEEENALKIENTLSGYVYELPKYPFTTQKNSCESIKNKSALQNISKSSELVKEQQTCRTSPHEPANITRKICINRHKAKASDSKKKSCETPGFVWEKQKQSPKHYDHMKQKCDWNEFIKYKSDKPEYGLEQKNRINSCADSKPVKRNPKLPECAYEVPISREIDNAERVWNNEKSYEGKCKKIIESEDDEQPKFIHKRPSQKHSCFCRESVKNKSESTEYAQELTKYRHKLPSQKSSCACRESVKNKFASSEYAQELTKSTHKPQSHKSSSECVSTSGKIQSGLPGYVFVVPKQTEKNFACTKSANNYSNSPHEAASKQVFGKSRLETKCIEPDTQNMCKNLVGTQTNTFEILNTIDLCKDVLKNQAETIEVLKKIYFSQKSETVSTSCSPSLTELPYVMKKYKDAATQPETANLSAEDLLHMPDAEFNKCLTSKQSRLSNKPKNISKFDIITRLKEAFKACSCKICDCFASSTPDKTDASKPYECDKCSRLISLNETNEQPICSCKPCDCVQCTKTLAKFCHSDPCQCGDCKRRSIHQGHSFLVAPVVTNEENNPRVACTCSPCACIECSLVYPLASSVVNEMSTSTNRHAQCRCEICLNENCDQSGFDSCKCRKHNKIMSKPVEHDTHEFDIRIARIVHNSSMFQRYGRNDTIAMLSVIPGRYPINALKPSHLFSSNKAKLKSDFNDRYNNCELNMPYEYQLNKTIQSHGKCCLCDTCDCFNCEKSNMPRNLHRFGRHRYSDGQYDGCLKNEKLGRDFHPFKKGDVLTPSTHKLKLQNLILEKQHLEEPSCSITKVKKNTESTSKLRDVDIFHELTSEFKKPNRKIGSSTQANFYMNNFNTRCINKRNILQKNIAIDDIISASCDSDYSSSYYKRFGNKSREGFRNNSDYNYPEYFIQFQKGTAATSITDVMKLDIDETIKLEDKCNIIQNSTEKHNVDKISYDNMSGNKTCWKINECNDFSNRKFLARETETNNNNSENAHIATMRRNCKNSSHVQLNNQNDIHKNCENNVLQNRERNELQNSTFCCSQSSLKMNNENREYMNAIHDFNKLHVARYVYYNCSEGNTSRRLLPMHDNRYNSAFSDFVDGANIINIKRVRNTLMEAKKVSQELIRLLEMYDKANEEFESISEKLKLPHPVDLM